MGFSVQAVRYGWVALASLGVLTGATIYVSKNQRHQVKPLDIIEIALGTDERVMALQTGTNESGAPVYPVARPSFVRTLTDTNGASVSVTNTIGWHIDRAMMVSLDATIKAIVPYYCDTNTVYAGTTNITMLTVTGLWASLGIGDRTNEFTRTPEIGTNAATYGDYPWQIYVEDLQERYKVLNALSCLSSTTNNKYAVVSTIEQSGKFTSDYAYDTQWYRGWDYVENGARYYWSNSPMNTPSFDNFAVGRWGQAIDYSKMAGGGGEYEFINIAFNQGWEKKSVSLITTNFAPTVIGLLVPYTPGNSTGDVFETFGDDLFARVEWVSNTLIVSYGNTDYNLDPPALPENRPPIGWAYAPPYPLPSWAKQRYARGYKASTIILLDYSKVDTNSLFATNGCFHYCTNKYW